jgi:hypothetical protein
MCAVNSPEERSPKTLAEGLQELVGKALASVEFVQDYVQFHFDGPNLTAYTLPSIAASSSAHIAPGAAGWRDALCNQIGCVVQKAEVQPELVVLSFENGAVVCISLRDADYRGPEALQFSLRADRSWVA